MKAAVLLSGCGIGDGSQVEEVMLTYLALDKRGINYVVFAPDKTQFDVINHITEEREDEKRNVLVESARIGRGRITNLNSLVVDEFDALILPGGLGVLKNLSNYALKSSNFEVDPPVKKVICQFHQNNKPVLAMCAAVVLVAQCLQKTATNLKLATANNAYKDLLISLGCKPINCAATEVVVDIKNNVASTPAFLASQNLNEIYKGLDKMISKLI